MLLAILGAASITSIMDEAAAKLRFHGVVRVERFGEQFERGYGLRPDTAFWVASIAKSFTAALVLRLVEARRMKLDDRVLGSDITVDELLTHTSGLPRSTYVAEGIVDAGEAARRILAQPSGPKGKFAYTNEGYTRGSCTRSPTTRSRALRVCCSQSWCLAPTTTSVAGSAFPASAPAGPAARGTTATMAWSSSPSPVR